MKNFKLQLFNNDFRDKLNDIKEQISIIITDPPYNIKYNYDNYYDNLPEKEYILMLKNFKGLPIAIIHYPEETMKYIVPALGVPNEVLIWCYNSNIGRQSRLINIYNKKVNFNAVKQPYKNPNDKRIQKRIKNGIIGAKMYDWFSDIQLVKNVSKEKYSHPCPMPEKLMERIILMTTKKGDTVVDPFMGRGTTGLAALKNNRNFIGIELSKKYYNVATKELNNYINKLK